METTIQKAVNEGWLKPSFLCDGEKIQCDKCKSKFTMGEVILIPININAEHSGFMTAKDKEGNFYYLHSPCCKIVFKVWIY
jgi:hypothetical protein